MTSNLAGRMSGATMAGMGLLLLASTPLMADEVNSAQPEPAATLPPLGQLDVTFSGLRSSKGYLRACLTQDRTHFPKCERDPAARTASVAAGANANLSFTHIPPGDYALLIFHDENGNSKMDTMLGIPREGVGFSRNPRLRFGAPGFDSVVISVPAGPAQGTAVKLQYFL